MSKGKVLLVAPTIYPVRRDGGYGGIERLVYLAAELLMLRGWEVSMVAAEGSKAPRGVQFYSAGPPLYDFREPSLLGGLAMWRIDGGDADACIDLSHSKASKKLGKLKSASILWHDPGLMSVAAPKNRLLALSRWHGQQLRIHAGVHANVFDPHIIPIDWSTERPAWRGDRFLVLGKLHPTKGALAAARMCKALGVPLDIVGPVTDGDPVEYVEGVKGLCDGQRIVYHGEVDEYAKIRFLRSCKALLYPVSYPNGRGEVHSHKMAEAQCYGAPCIAYDQGAVREVIKDGVSGFVVSGEQAFKRAMLDVDKLELLKVETWGVNQWAVGPSADRWDILATQIAMGALW